MAIQTKTGKAFEFSLLKGFFTQFSPITKVSIIENEAFFTAKKCFEEINENERIAYLINSRAAINFIKDIEPCLSYSINETDTLQLKIVADSEGQAGDVRDVLLKRPAQNWEIGISAKNNHRAVKHSRLSLNINFGEKWLGVPCSKNYFEEIKPVFTMLENIKKQDQTRCWDSIDNMHQVVYVPILNAFRNELLKLDKENPGIVAQKLVEYLIGNQDFYKVIKGKNKVEIQVYNLHGSLNQPFKEIKPKAKIQKLKLPSRLIEIVYENNSATTLLVSLNEGWQISFRIHSAKSTIEPSLKFDINLVSAPHTLFTNHIFI